MRIEQYRWTAAEGWWPKIPDVSPAQLLLVFGGPAALRSRFLELKEIFPESHLFGCSTAGEICGTEVFDDSLILTAVEFEHTRLDGTLVNMGTTQNSFEAGCVLARSLDHNDLAHVLVLSDGLAVNVSELVRGLTANLPTAATLTGGLAGDGDRFQETLVSWDCPPRQNCVAAV